MKKMACLLTCAVFFWALGFAAPALAANKGEAYTLSPMFGWHIFEGDQDLDDDFTYGLGLGYNFTPHWGTELMLNFTDTDPDDPAVEDHDVLLATLNAIFNIMPHSAFVPYLQAGVGGVTNNPDLGDNSAAFLVNYGLGVKFFVTENLALRADAKHFMAFQEGIDESTPTDNNVLLTAGLTYQLGWPEPAPEPAREVAPAPAPAPADSDGDGVPDSRDQCPDTPRGVAVDQNGCPLDSDGDGVPDYLDQCPDTDPGVIVDEQGCPLSMSINIFFGFDKAEVDARFHEDLREAADFIERHEAPKILIAGHTDEVGTSSYNLELSQRRAEAVRRYLIDNFDISADRLVARGYGETRPVASNETAEGRQQNRRTDIVCCVFIPEE